MYDDQKQGVSAAPAATSPIAEIVMSLHEQIHQCTTQMEQLKKALTPVSRPESAVAGNVTANVPSESSPMHNSLSDAVAHLRFLSVRIAMLHQSLDV